MTKRDFRRNEELKLRTIPVLMSDRDLKRLLVKCGKSNITIQELFETFVGDLVHGTFFSGSDESMYANDWYDRHGFSWIYEDSLLAYLLRYGSPNTVDDFITAWEEREYHKDHPEEYSSKCDRWWDKDIKEALEYFDGEPTEDDIKKTKEWLENYERMFI